MLLNCKFTQKPSHLPFLIHENTFPTPLFILQYGKQGLVFGKF